MAPLEKPCKALVERIALFLKTSSKATVDAEDAATTGPQVDLEALREQMKLRLPLIALEKLLKGEHNANKLVIKHGEYYYANLATVATLVPQPLLCMVLPSACAPAPGPHGVRRPWPLHSSGASVEGECTCPGTPLRTLSSVPVSHPGRYPWRSRDHTPQLSGPSLVGRRRRVVRRPAGHPWLISSPPLTGLCGSVHTSDRHGVRVVLSGTPSGQG